MEGGVLKNPNFLSKKQQKNKIVIIPMRIFPSSKKMDLNEKIFLKSRY